jgi:DNA-binding response OmpR family regulator
VLGTRFGFDATLAKPCDFDEVVAAIRRLDGRSVLAVRPRHRLRALAT